MTQTCFENAAICTAMIAALSLVPAVHADECEQLDSLELPHTEITISERIEAGTFAAAGANPSTRDAFASLPLLPGRGHAPPNVRFGYPLRSLDA